MSIPRFDEKELEVVGEMPESPFMPAIKLYNTPVTAREAVRGAFSGKGCWQILGLVDERIFTPRILPDNVARALVFEAQPFDPGKGGGPDMFGIEWEYVPQAGGSMVRPGKPLIGNANEIKDKLVWPDIDKWDWEGSARENNSAYLATDKFNMAWFQTGFFERLISLMDFEGAILALVDEDQQEAVHAFFGRLADLYIRIFEKYITWFPAVDGFYFHDDWGSQKETFFSPATVEEMIVPHMKRVTDFLHSKGKFCELHSCGQVMKQVPNMIKAGWDAWGGQAMNDTQKIYELYGDKLLIGVIPDLFDPAGTPEEKQREMAREYADRFCRPDKPSYFSHSGAGNLTPAYREELYRQSRINYSR